MNLDVKELFKFGFPTAYEAKVHPTEETKNQTVRLQDRSKYDGNGNIREVESSDDN